MTLKLFTFPFYTSKDGSSSCHKQHTHCSLNPAPSGAFILHSIVPGHSKLPFGRAFPHSCQKLDFELEGDHSALSTRKATFVASSKPETCVLRTSSFTSGSSTWTNLSSSFLSDTSVIVKIQFQKSARYLDTEWVFSNDEACRRLF